MSEKVFNSLAGSLREAGKILSGETKEFRQFVRKRPINTKPISALAICTVADDEELIAGKLYTVNVMPASKITVKDESGETVICDASDFILVEFKPAVELRIRKIVGVVSV